MRAITRSYFALAAAVYLLAAAAVATPMHTLAKRQGSDIQQQCVERYNTSRINPLPRAGYFNPNNGTNGSMLTVSRAQVAHDVSLQLTLMNSFARYGKTAAEHPASLSMPSFHPIRLPMFSVPKASSDTQRKFGWEKFPY